MYRVVKSCYIDMAHRLRGHKGKCAHIHGHTYKIEISLSCETLDEMGMAVDFGDIKQNFFQPVVDQYDHWLVLCPDDVRVFDQITNHPLLVLLSYQEATGNPTAEWFAKKLYDLAQGTLATPELVKRRDGYGGVKIDYVRVYEQLHPTESYAEYRP